MVVGLQLFNPRLGCLLILSHMLPFDANAVTRTHTAAG